MQWWNDIQSGILAGQGWGRLVTLFLIILIGLAGGRLARLLLHRSAEEARKRGRAVTGALLRAVGQAAPWAGFTLGARIGLAFIDVRPGMEDLLQAAINVLVILTFGYLAYGLVDVLDEWIMVKARRSHNSFDHMIAPMVRTSSRVTILVLVVLQIAQALTDKPLTTILAGLGVGGLAIALAAQDTVKNFFGSLVIFADKPFLMGDRIVVDGFDGVIEEVGFRSTRLRTLDGHLVTIPNGELANKSIQNIGRRPSIRRLFSIGLTYNTPPARVQRAIDIVQGILKDHEGMHPDFKPRVYFNNFGAYSLDLMIIYWYHPADYWAYMAFSERVNRSILEQFTAEGISFAFPTQTVHVQEASGQVPS